MALTRRMFTLGIFALPGCTAISSLNEAAQPRDTFALQPINIAAEGRRSARSLLVLEPTASAAIDTDRILIRRDPLSVTYLPDARWADGAPQMLQSILVQSLAATGRIGFVGVQGAGPIPDTVLLTRIDDFGVDRQADGLFVVRIACELTLLRDRDQRVIDTRRFAQSGNVSDDAASTIAQGFQTQLDALLSDAVPWVLMRAI
ncbi:ABC-type transport auxiliary lipoprotein family protein [Yoonia sp. GPGPB17]|uniref:ABC-type transport auxiliary lipoprotein family protein n=1 Tax=Yoonia sp. GPGPB17 TaxID=3026147 RepID=UPI0030C29D47